MLKTAMDHRLKRLLYLPNHPCILHTNHILIGGMRALAECDLAFGQRFSESGDSFF